jgi:hypothetical protein
MEEGREGGREMVRSREMEMEMEMEMERERGRGRGKEGEGEGKAERNVSTLYGRKSAFAFFSVQGRGRAPP